MGYYQATRPRNNFSRGRTGGGFKRRGGPQKQHIDYRRFIKQAVVVEDSAPYEPVHQFADFAIDERLKANLIQNGYSTPTPIQDQSIPAGLSGKDVLGIANTGTGKTAAFLLPLIQRVVTEPSTETVLILAPVRELAQQIEAEFIKMVRGSRLSSVVCIGGSPIERQISQLRRDPQFVIGTPGRVKDLTERGIIKLEKFTAVVLDEVDRMLDMGFIDDIRTILKAMPETKQSLFFSATLSPEIERLISQFMQEPVKITVKTTETSDNVEQDVVRVGYGMSKLEVLHDLLAKPELQKVLVFGETKYGVEKLAKILNERGFKAESIHGNKTQGQRSRAIQAFRDHRVNILVATDVAARGLDIKGVTHVINYDLPNTYDDYAHRIGRTGRAGQKGHSLTFIES